MGGGALALLPLFVSLWLLGIAGRDVAIPRRLALSYNSLLGALPAALSTLSSLQELSLTSSGLVFDGPLPAYFPASFSFLETLEVGSTNITGGLGALANLTLLSRCEASSAEPFTLPRSWVPLAVPVSVTRPPPSSSSFLSPACGSVDLSGNSLGGLPDALSVLVDMKALNLRRVGACGHTGISWGRGCSSFNCVIVELCQRCALH